MGLNKGGLVRYVGDKTEKDGDKTRGLVRY